MTGMAVLLLVRPIVRHRDRFAQSDERDDGWSADGEHLDRGACDTGDDWLAVTSMQIIDYNSRVQTEAST